MLFEAGPEIGGGLRSAALTEPGYVHDVCSTVQTLGVASPAFADLELEAHGVEWVHPPIPLAHPLDGGRAATLHRDVAETATGFGDDAASYRRVLEPLDRPRRGARRDLPLAAGPAATRRSRGARFGFHALRSAQGFAAWRISRATRRRRSSSGAAAHAIQPLTAPATAGYGLFLLLLAHAVRLARRARRQPAVADALGRVLRAHGGEIVTDHEVTDLDALPTAPVTMLDVTPRQLCASARAGCPTGTRRRLRRFRYGPGVCKVDWALTEPIPWTHTSARAAGTVHVGRHRGRDHRIRGGGARRPPPRPALRARACSPP